MPKSSGLPVCQSVTDEPVEADAVLGSFDGEFAMQLGRQSQIEPAGEGSLREWLRCLFARLDEVRHDVTDAR